MLTMWKVKTRSYGEWQKKGGRIFDNLHIFIVQIANLQIVNLPLANLQIVNLQIANLQIVNRQIANLANFRQISNLQIANIQNAYLTVLTNCQP